MYVSYIFDEDGVMYSDTYFGDYPHYSPDQVSRQTTSGGFGAGCCFLMANP